MKQDDWVETHKQAREYYRNYTDEGLIMAALAVLLLKAKVSDTEGQALVSVLFERSNKKRKKEEGDE